MATVYVSSTYSDLKDCRETVYRALRQLGHDVRAMENYVASDKRPLQKCLDDVGRCDIYVGIFAWRYGFIPEEDNPNQKSITELEFRHASQHKIPTLIFLLMQEADWPISHVDRGEESKKIDSLRSELALSKTVSFFKNCENLAALVCTAVTNKVKELEEEQNEQDLKAVSGWLEKHLHQTESEFISHLSGMDQLTAEQASARYVELLVEKHTRPDQEKELARPLSDYVARRGARLVVLGEGGAGKTTSLLKLAFDAARRAGLDPTAPIPIYVKLNFFDTKERGFDKLIEIIAASSGLPQDQVLSLWREDSRSILFLMDGFNEIGSDFQSSCARALEALMQRHQHICVITSRPVSQVRSLAERCKIDELNVVQLSDYQLEDFLTRHGAARLYQQMGSELKDLARNPFLLWALAQSCVGLAKTELPRNKGQLYRKLIDTYLFETQEQRKEPSPTEYNYERVKRPVLASLALRMTQEGVTRNAQDINLLREVHKQLTEIRTAYEGLVDVKPYELMPDPLSAKGVLDEAVLNGVLRRVGDTIEFMHQSVQDYFAAVGMLDWKESQILNLAPPSSFENAFERSDGFEAIVMLAGLKHDTGELLESLIGHNPLLAAHCVAASSTVPGMVRSKLLHHCKTMLHQQNMEYRKLACSCLETARIESEELQRDLIDLALFDEEYEVQNAASYTLAQIKSAYAVNYVVDLGLREPYDDKTLKEVSELLFKIDLGAAVTSLFDKWRKSEVGGERRRRAEILLTPRSWEESKVSNQLSMIRLDAIRREDTEASQAAKEALALLKVWQKSHGKKSSILHASEIRRRMREMANLAESVPNMSISELIENLNQNNYVAGHVAAEIGRRGAKEGLEPLIETLYRQRIHKNIKPIVQALESIDRAQAQQYLRAGLQNSDSAKQTRAAVALGLMGDFESIALVQKALRVENSAFRGSAARVLGNFGSDEAVAALTDAAQSENDVEVFQEVIGACGSAKSESAINALLNLLLRRHSAISLDHEFSPDGDTLRQVARRALVEAAGVGQVIAWLRESAQDKDSFVRAKAIAEMSSFDDEQFDIASVLREALDDQEGIVRAAALRGIAKRTGGKKELADIFEKAGKDKDARVRSTALDEWVNCGIEGAQAALIESALSDPDSHVRDTAAMKLRGFLEAATDQLSKILEQGETNRRIAAVKTLGKIGESVVFTGIREGTLNDEGKEKVLAPLSRALGDADERVRLESVKALRSVRYSESQGLVIPILVDVAWHGENVDLRQEAAQLLEYMDDGNSALFKPIWDRLDDRDEYDELIKLIGEDQPFLPNNGYLYALRGDLRQDLKRFDKAHKDYETALKLGFDNAWLRKNCAIVCNELGLYEEAREAARKAVEYAPDDAEAHFMLGWHAYKAGDYRESIEESKIALGLDQTLAMAAFNLGLAYIADHRLDKARTIYDQAIKSCEEMPEEDAKAMIQAALKDIDELLVAEPKLAPDANELKSKLSSILTAK